MNLQFHQVTFFAMLLAAPLLAGCSPSATNDSADDQHEHESHDSPSTLADAIPEVERLRGVIQKGFAGGDPEQAHGALHKIGHVLEELPELARKASLPEEHQQQVEQASESLMQSFGIIDDGLHSGDSKGKTYADQAEQIDAAMQKLQAVKIPEK